jgi:hypothetical protein
VRAHPKTEPRLRALRADDLPAVAALYVREMAPGATPRGVAELLRSAVLDCPWADPELPALVALDEQGELEGFFLGCARRMRVGDRPLRAMCGMTLLVDPRARGAGTAFDLLSTTLRGQQDLSFTDGVPFEIQPLLARMACRPLQLESLEWTRVLRPASYWRSRVSGLSRRLAAARPARVLDRALALRPPVLAHGISDEQLTPELMIAHYDELSAWARLRPAYDLPYLRWLFAQLSAGHPQGELAARLVRRDGEPIGWHVGLVQPGGLAEAMQVLARPGEAPTVFDALLAHAHARGAIAARGRLEAPLLDAITSRRALLRRTSFVMARVRDPELLAAIQNGEALFTRLDADWWIDPRGR